MQNEVREVSLPCRLWQWVGVWRACRVGVAVVGGTEGLQSTEDDVHLLSEPLDLLVFVPHLTPPLLL